MTINLNQNKNLKLFKIISEVAAQNNQSVYIVGGYVRDLLMTEGYQVLDGQASARNVVAADGVEAGHAMRAPRDDDRRHLSRDRGDVVV